MEEGESPDCPALHVSEDLSQHHILNSFPSFQELAFHTHTRERKRVCLVSLLPAHVCKAPREENHQTPQAISVITLDPYVP